MKPLLTILTAGLEKRRAAFEKGLRQKLSAQIDKEQENVVHLCAFTDGKKVSSGQVRQSLLVEACNRDSAYVCFLDDDDDISDDYLYRLIGGCTTGANIVTFKAGVTMVREVIDRRTRKPRIVRRNEVWDFGLHQDMRWIGMMQANHLCAWQASIASQVAWCPHLGYGDDQLWYKPLHMAYPDLTQFHIDEILYFYEFDYRTTANQTAERIAAAKSYFGGRGLRVWREVSGSILVEHPHVKSVFKTFPGPTPPEVTSARNKDNEYVILGLSNCPITLLGTVHLK